MPRNSVPLTLIVASFVAVTALAQTPPVTETNATPATTQTATTATTTTTADTANATTPQTSDAKPKKPFKRPPGYRMAKRNGITYYCRKDASIGSRVETTKCFTQEQLEEMAMVNSESIEASQQAMRVCVNPQNCGGM
jgi:hypothetical protein